jgi:hypothetical protein
MRDPRDQLATLNEWLSEHRPDAYWNSPELDTAAVVISVLEEYRRRSCLECGGTSMLVSVCEVCWEKVA